MIMIKALAPSHRRETLVFLAASSLVTAAALAVGLDGNPLANALAFVAAATLVLAFVHPWARAREFNYLSYAAGLGFAVFVILHNLLEVGAEASASGGPMHAILQALSAVTFFAAVFLCPPAFVIGGSVVMFVRGRRDGR